MRNLLAISVLLNVAFVAGVWWQELTAHAVGGGVPAGNGDVNGDGRIDIADGIYIITHQFRGGPPPVPIECPPPVVKGLLATGQMRCYDMGGFEIPCDNTTCPGQDARYATGCPSEGRFVDNLDGTVTDTCTGLMWQKDTAETNGDGQILLDGSDIVTWCAALDYCESLSFAGHDDLRLPNVREFLSIVDYERSDPGIDPGFGATSFN